MLLWAFLTKPRQFDFGAYLSLNQVSYCEIRNLIHMAQLNIFSNIIRGIRNRLPLGIRRERKSDLIAKNSNCFVLQYTKGYQR